MSEITPNEVILSGLFGAIIGALLPLLVLPYFRHRRRIYDRRLKHYNSLILLELRLLDIESTLHDDIIALSSILRAVKSGKATTHRPMETVLEDRFFSDFYVRRLNNKLYSLRYDLRRLNQDLRNFNNNYDLLTHAVVLKNIEIDYYSKQIDGIVSGIPSLIGHLERIKMDSANLLHYVRVRQEKDNTWLMRYRSWIIQRRIKSVTKKDIEKKERKHSKDIEDSARKHT